MFRPAQVTSPNGFTCLFSVQSEKALSACRRASVAGSSLGPPGNINATANKL